MNYFTNYAELFKPEEILDYLRKSQSDDPLLTVEEVLQKHETILDEWDEKHLCEKCLSRTASGKLFPVRL